MVGKISATRSHSQSAGHPGATLPAFPITGLFLVLNWHYTRFREMPFRMNSINKISIKNTAHNVFEEARDSGFRPLICRSTPTVCGCIGVDVLLPENEIEVFSDYLIASGFHQKIEGTRTNGSDYTVFVGYCDICSTTVQLNVSCSLTVGCVSGNHLVFKNTEDLFIKGLYFGDRQAGIAVEVIALVCAAAMLGEFQTDNKRSKLSRAIELHKELSAGTLFEISGSLIGDDATRYLEKTLVSSQQWEIDLLLSELKLALKGASDVEFNSDWFNRFKDRASLNDIRYTDSHSGVERFTEKLRITLLTACLLLL